MNTVLKIFLSMSVSGGLLILALLLGKHLMKDKISRQWQYYIWLVVILRLLLPFGPETNLMGETYQAVDQAIIQPASLPQQQISRAASKDGMAPAVEMEPEHKNVNDSAEDLTAANPLQEIGALLVDQIWLVWLAAALGLLIRKVTIYQDFVRYIRTGLTQVPDIEILDRLSVAAQRAGVKKPVELCINPLVSSPLLIGFFHPCIVLPGEDIPKKDFQHIILHELTHYRRRDMFYKWLVQITVCLHWFNPLVHLMSREITRACEFSCDEAVLARMGGGSAQDYGKTLLDAMAAVGKYKENLGAVTLSENKQLLRERLDAIMRFKERSKAVKRLTAALTLCVILGASYVGVYPAAAAANAPNSSNTEDNLPEMETLDFRGTTYYLVQNEAQLRAIGTGGYGMDQNYIQQADIRLSADEWTPIGTRDHPFIGTFNGNGYEIIGLTMTDPDAEVVGLFGVAKSAQIYNITMRDEDIERAGKNAAHKSVGAILAIGGSSYDNTVYPKGTGENDWQDELQTDHGFRQEESAGDSREKWQIASAQAEAYYEAGSLPLFEIAFSQLDERTQKTWLETLYADGSFAFFSAAVRALGEDRTILADYGEKAYSDGSVAFFSILTDHMDKAQLERWLDRAMKDDRWNFQSMLFDKLNMSDEKDVQEKVWEERQMAEYQAAGVTMDGKNYYYQGQLVNIFLDIRANNSFYTLDTNPAGTVNIKITRDTDDEITGVAYMTEAEAANLLGDMNDPDHKTDVKVIPVDFHTVAAGETIFLGEYTLSDGDEILYDISAKTGNRIKVFFVEDEQEDVVYWSVNNLRQPGEPLECIADFIVEPPAAKPGTYKLYLQAPDGALGNVRGSVSIASADAP